MRSTKLRSARATTIAVAILLLALSTFAQTSAPSTADQKPSSPLGSASQDNKEQPGASAQGGLEILSDTMGVDFGPYLSRVLQNVRQNWYNLIPFVARPPLMKKGKLAIEFAITRDGSVAGMRLVASSGDVTMDRAAWGGITASNPFPPLPTEFKGQYLALRFHFYYNPSPTDIALARASGDVLRKLVREKHAANATADLQSDLRGLSSLLDGGHLDASSEVEARFYRGMTIYLLGWLRDHLGQPADTTEAQQALTDFDRVIASNTNIPGWKNTISAAEYTAGLIARSPIRSNSVAYSYWDKCAQQGDGDCLYQVATGHLIGTSRVSPDFGEALSLYRKAFETGPTYQCAAARSAQRIAMVLHFTDAKATPQENPLVWVEKSYGFSEASEAREKKKNSCNAADAKIEEFLYRLSDGDRRDDLLNQAALQTDDDSPAVRAVLKYFSGSLDETAFEAEVKISKYEGSRCYAYFEAMWYAEITKNRAAADEYYKRLSDEGRVWCQPELVFAKNLQR